MSTNQFTYNPFLGSINNIRKSWGWFLTVGILLVIFGAICIVGNVTATFATVFVVGWLLLAAAVVALVHAFTVRSWGGFFLFLLTAAFRGVTGYLLIRYPIAGAMGFTLVLASFFIVAGFCRMVGSTVLKFPSWGWSVFSGLVSMALGIMLFAQMPVSGFWFLGFAIGLDMIFDGASFLGLAGAIRSLPEGATASRAKAA